uniref:Dynactin subunit 5 n=1 Tax=Steinernema glaseri TaxID=37863 RepID=A0A1I7ZST8_9BILA
MELPQKYVDKALIVETATGNKVHRRVTLNGSQNIVLNGKCILMEDCILRADLNSIRTGKYCIINPRTIIRPSYKRFTKGFTFFAVIFGDHVFVEEDCVIMAAQIGSYVHIGKGAIIGRSTVIKDCCVIKPGAVLPADMIVPPFSIVEGNPAKIVGDLPESTPALMMQATKQFYDNYTTINPDQHKST